MNALCPEIRAPGAFSSTTWIQTSRCDHSRVILALLPESPIPSHLPFIKYEEP